MLKKFMPLIMFLNATPHILFAPHVVGKSFKKLFSKKSSKKVLATVSQSSTIQSNDLGNVTASLNPNIQRFEETLELIKQSRNNREEEQSIDHAKNTSKSSLSHSSYDHSEALFAEADTDPTSPYANIPSRILALNEQLRHELNLEEDSELKKEPIWRAEELIDQGANPNERSEDWGATLLYLAAMKGDIGVVAWLLDQKGTDPFVTDRAGRTPRKVAELFNKNGSRSSIIELLQKAEKKQKQRNQPLHPSPPSSSSTSDETDQEGTNYCSLSAFKEEPSDDSSSDTELL